MKVLVIDDNEAIQEIIAEILGVDGYTTEIAGSLEEARSKLSSFKPSGILLDSVVNGESSLPFLDELDPKSGVKVLILTSGKEKLPKDSPLIYGHIQKPFRSVDIIDNVRGMTLGEAAAAKKKKAKFKLFGHKKPETEETHEAEIHFGRSYIVFENEPFLVYTIAHTMQTRGCDVMVVTSESVKYVNDKIGGETMRILGLSSRLKAGYVEMSKLGTLMASMVEFIEQNAKPVVIIDNLQPLIEANSLNGVLTMIYQLINGGAKKISSVIISAPESSFTDKDKDLLLMNMELYKEGPSVIR